MHPILFHIGDFPVGTYGVILAIAALLAIVTTRQFSVRVGVDPERITDLAIYSLLAAFVGGKIAMIIGDFREFSDHPVQYFLENLRAFGAFYGGFIAALLVAIVYLRKHEISFWKAGDVIAPGLALGQAIGRWGCFFAGCCHGRPTEAPWGLSFPEVPICYDGTLIHPWPVYESLGDLALFGILLWRFGRRRFTGQIFLTYVILYAVLRGGLEFFRGDLARGLYFGDSVSLSQILAIAVVAVAVPFYFVLRRRGEDPEEPEEEE